MRYAVVLVALLWFARTAAAEAYAQRWPSVPVDPAAPLGERVLDRLTTFAAAFERELDTLTVDLISLHLDPRGRKASIFVGAGDRRLGMRVGGDVHVEDGAAQILARVDLAAGGRTLRVNLPRFEMAATSYRGERGIEIRLPLLRRRF